MVNIDETSRPIVAEALRALEDDAGKLTAIAVFEAAKDKASPLHDFFEWDKTTAWEAHNLEIARSLIRTVVYKRVVSENVTMRPVPVYVRDPACEPAAQGYVSLRNVVANSPSAYAIVLNEIERVTAALSRAQAIAGEIGFLDDVNDLISRVDDLKDRVNEKGARADA